jgi:hypothetical protein
VYACHCTDCQKRSGSAFGLSLWVRRPAIELVQGEPELQTPVAHDGKPRPGRACRACGIRLWSEPAHRPGLAVIRPGTLDDTSQLRPHAHMWRRSAQPWFVFPEGARCYEGQADFQELLALGKDSP